MQEHEFDRRLAKIEQAVNELYRLIDESSPLDDADRPANGPWLGVSERVEAELRAGRQLQAINFQREETGQGTGEARSVVMTAKSRMGM